MTRCVYLVHCLDTEGPLYESLDATFERLDHAFHLDLEPSRTTLKKLQRGEMDLGGLENAVQTFLNPDLLRYNETWDQIDGMLEDALSPAFRNRHPDSDGRGWIYNWFCVDHVTYDVNPRRRDMGYHNVFDHYRRALRETESDQDGLHFHFHPQPFRPHAHRCATRWMGPRNTLAQVLSRRVIDRHWFPVANRPGFHVNRPDSHWFLEQYLPFDFSSQAVESTTTDDQQFDLSNGRFGDWRRAPQTWTPYHPSHDDYQVPGDCRRWIARCLNVGTRLRLLTREHVAQAFREAQDGRPVVLAFTNHDFRDIRPDVEATYDLIRDVASDFPTVPFRHAEAVSAMRNALDLTPQPPCELELDVCPVGDSAHVLTVRSETPTFGPQPWLALKTVTDDYHHDNFDILRPFHEWRYVFDRETLPLRAVDRIGVAANNAYGITTVAVHNVASRATSTRYLNQPEVAHEAVAS